MQNISDIKNRIKSIKETAQITKAMEMISVSKMNKANQKYLSNIRYYDNVRDTIKSIMQQSGNITHPYLQSNNAHRTAFVVIASDTGLAGDYNNRILKFAYDRISRIKGDKSVFTIGQMANEFFSRKGIVPAVEFLYAAQDPTLDDARRITAELVDLYDNNKISRVIVMYTVANGLVKQPTMMQLLPLRKRLFTDGEDDSVYINPIEFEPSPREVFDILVPQYVLGIIYSALIQSVRCEHMERMATMNNATKNANEMVDDLEVEYHRARQNEITTEIAEMSSSHPQ